MSTTTPDRNEGIAPTVNLGLRLRQERKGAGLSLRELARRLGVSPSFVSQIENGKAQPSVGTLYSVSQLLKVSIDDLFSGDEATDTTEAREGAVSEGVDKFPDMPSVLAHAAARRTSHASSDAPGQPRKRADLGSLEGLWDEAGGSRSRLSVTVPHNRTRLVMETGVVWEQLATNTANQLDFMEITYPPGASSTNDDRMLRHDGFEYGYLLQGELEVTLGFDVFTLHENEAVGLSSSVPHLFRNRSTIAARGIWIVHHDHD